MASTGANYRDCSEGSDGTHLKDLIARVLRGQEAVWRKSIGSGQASSATIAAIRYHGVSFLLSARSELMIDWPEEVMQIIRNDARLQGIWESSHKHAVAVVIEELAKNGVSSVISKGTALAYSVFSDPAMRQRGDTDLVVCPEDANCARRVFNDQGWFRGEASSMQENWSYNSGAGFVHTIDLHWQANASAATRQLFTPGEAITRSIDLPRLSPSARSLDPALLFLAGSLNQVLHAVAGYLVEGETIYGQERLIWSLGNHLQLDGFSEGDWDRLAREAVARGAGYLCKTTIEATQSRFQTEVSPRILTILEAEGLSGEIDAFLFEQSALARLGRSLRDAYDWRDRLEILKRNIVMREEPLRHRYPAMDGTPLAILQARRWMEGFAKIVLRRASAGFTERVPSEETRNGPDQ